MMSNLPLSKILSILLVLIISLYIFACYFFISPFSNFSQHVDEKARNNLMVSLVNHADSQTTGNDAIFDMSLKSQYSKIDVSFNNKAYCPQKFKGTDKHQALKRFLETDHDTYFFSYQLKNGKWMNVKETLRGIDYDRFAMFFLGLLIIFIFVGVLFWLLAVMSISMTKIKHSMSQLGLDIETNIKHEYSLKVVGDSISIMKQMQTRIRNLLFRQNRMMAAISHDLRVPINRIGLKVYCHTDEAFSDQIQEDIKEADHMITQITDYAQQEIKQEEKVRFDIQSLLLESFESFQNQEGETFEKESCEKIIFKTSMSGDVPFFGENIQIKRCFSNLIDNAIKYGSCVEISLERIDDGYLIIFRDRGEGVKQNELVKLTDPLYRSQAAQVSKLKGSGLGLSIVKHIIESHHGTLTIQNSDISSGLEVRLFLPFQKEGSNTKV